MEKSPNPLAVWLAANRIKKSDFAAVIGVSNGRVTQILQNGVSGLDLAKRIEAATSGAIPIEVWLDGPIDVRPILPLQEQCA